MVQPSAMPGNNTFIAGFAQGEFRWCEEVEVKADVNAAQPTSETPVPTRKFQSGDSISYTTEHIYLQSWSLLREPW